MVAAEGGGEARSISSMRPGCRKPTERERKGEAGERAWVGGEEILHQRVESDGGKRID